MILLKNSVPFKGLHYSSRRLSKGTVYNTYLSCSYRSTNDWLFMRTLSFCLRPSVYLSICSVCMLERTIKQTDTDMQIQIIKKHVDGQAPAIEAVYFDSLCPSQKLCWGGSSWVESVLSSGVLKCLVQGHNTVTPPAVKLKLRSTLQSPV